MPTLRRHTHLQAAQANTKTKGLQKNCNTCPGFSGANPPLALICNPYTYFSRLQLHIYSGIIN